MSVLTQHLKIKEIQKCQNMKNVKNGVILIKSYKMKSQICELKIINWQFIKILSFVRVI